MRRKKKNLLRGPPYNKPEEKYGSPEDLEISIKNNNDERLGEVIKVAYEVDKFL
ncbi:MAG TPA: hypothetical protein PL110_15675 [Candidatus Eremiobacteraeota bacterium]|nr:hypothetical protein [Candidatus Eremiobacteraeota bacterium]